MISENYRLSLRSEYETLRNQETSIEFDKITAKTVIEKANLTMELNKIHTRIKEIQRLLLGI